MFEYRAVLARLRLGDSDRDIAKARLMGRAKVAALRALATQHGWLQPATPIADEATIAAVIGQARRARTTISSAEPFRAQIEAWAAEGVSGVAIHGALCRNHNFTGSYSAVRRVLQSVAATRAPEATVRLQFAPGSAAQVDFGAGPFLVDPASGTRRRAWAFVMTLCFSRHQYVEFVWDQTVATWLGCHRRAFEWFGGVPDRVIIDNAKCAITRACVHDPVVQRAYAECAEGYGFRIDPCPPGDPQKKGIVEAGVKYVKRSFLPTREFRDLTDLNGQARDWVMTEAGLREHGTTRAKPLALFILERSALRPLPAIAPDLGTWSVVPLHRDCHIQFERSYYSAPFTLIGQDLWLRATDTTIALHHEHRQVALHLRSRERGSRTTVLDHLPPAARAFFGHDRDWCLARAAEVGIACRRLVEDLLHDPVLERLRSTQSLLRLTERYGAVRLEAACLRALVHGSANYRTVNIILARGHDRLPLPTIDATAHPYGGSARFVRDAESLFGVSSSLQ